MKILVVDDDEICLKLITTGLQKAGYDVLGVGSAQAALEALQDTDPIALMITDVMMPEMDGLELLNRLRSTISLKRLPVLICSALATQEAAARAAQLKVAGYLLKPIDVKALRAKVEAILGPPTQHLAPVAATLKRLDIAEKLYLDMLQALLTKLSSGLTEMQELAAQKESRRLSTRVSALHGAAQNLGAERLAHILLRQAQASERKNFKAVQSLIPEIENEAAQLREEISKLPKEPSLPQPPMPADTKLEEEGVA